jgi:hypothetical protein
MGVLQDSLRPRWCLWARGYWGDARNHHRYGAVARGRRTLPMLAGAACKKKKIITSIRWNPPPLAVRLLQALPFPAWIETAPIEEGTEGHEDGHVRRGRVDPT